MHSDSNSQLKKMVGLDTPLLLKDQISCLEEDLALSSSTHDSIADKTITEPEEKIHDDTTVQSLPESEQPAPIYMSEDAMDCNYDESSNVTQLIELLPQEVPASPELFESDADDEAESTTSTFPTTLEEPQVSQPTPKKYTSTELILRADKFLLRRMNKYLSGVPPPPSHTISQRDSDDFLAYLKQNQQYFWANPFALDKKNTSTEVEASFKVQESAPDKNENENEITSNTNKDLFQSRAGLRNLSIAFDECEKPSSLHIDNNDSLAVPDRDCSDTSSFSLSESLFSSCLLSTSTFASLTEPIKPFDFDKTSLPSLYNSVTVEEVVTLSWPTVYFQRCQEIYYNRNKAVEDFENLRIKLCDRYIGVETQSTCNIWFAKQMPGSARKRALLAKRNNGQSPGKRLSYLARRRKTFSSANLQGLGLAEKKQVMLNVRKGLLRKGKSKSPRGKSPRGKSPRGKSPRGKSPRNGKSPRRKTPHSSAKKRHLRKLLLDGPSPRKTKIETSKRALFQSPPTDKPGPSRSFSTMPAINNPQKIKRALFPTPKKNEENAGLLSQSLNFPECRKRKSEEELTNSKVKHAKSLSFDCPRNLDSTSSSPWNPVRYSTGSILSKDESSKNGKCELSDIHRKKLLWAVAEALRGKGIGMNHPMFKQYATSLARTVRKFMPDLENKLIPRKPGSTSDRMLKLAKRHVILIVDTKTAL